MRWMPLIFLLSSGVATAQIDLESAAKRLLGQPEEEQTDTSTTHPSGLGEAQMTEGLREALDAGVRWAVGQLGVENGFYGNDQVRIPIPDKLNRIADVARNLGQDRYVDELILSMNRAAEKAIPATTDILIGAIQSMTVEESLKLIQGGDDAITSYFRRTSEDDLRRSILPIVQEATDASGVATAYKKLEDQGGGLMSMLGSESTNLDDYVTDQSLDALFLFIAEQERNIREDPLARTTDLLQKLFSQ